LQLSSLSGGRLLHPQPEDVPFHGDKGSRWSRHKRENIKMEREVRMWTGLNWLRSFQWQTFSMMVINFCVP
jgi:hypothetical protein